MIIDVARIPPAGERFSGEEPASVLELDNEPIGQPSGPVHYDLLVSHVPGELLARGKISVEAVFRCVRCAEAFKRRVVEPDFTCMIEVKNETESVDLTPEIREATILAFPTYPVCSPDCAGLCPHCGANLNKGKCNCRPPQDLRWGSLEKLDIK
jgi:uncharacterized protein